MSTSLRKLCDHFDDPIISYSRDRTELTPLEEALRPEVAEMLQLGWDMLMLQEQFDPATSSAIFRLATIDSLDIVLLPHLLRLVTAAAPHVTIVSAPTPYSTPENIFKTGADVVSFGTDFRMPSSTARSSTRTSSSASSASIIPWSTAP